MYNPKIDYRINFLMQPFNRKIMIVHHVIGEGLTHSELIMKTKQVALWFKKSLNHSNSIPINHLSKHSGLTCFNHR